MRIGVDTGGTFTDVIVLRDDGRVDMFKVPSTPTDPSRAIIEGIQAAHAGRPFDLVHGTTVATNALLERRGAKTGLITSSGCRDVLEIGRQTRDQLYSLTPQKTEPLIPRELRIEVPERLDWQGEVVTKLDNTELEAELQDLKEKGVESVAVCFLFSFLRPDHEIHAGRRAESLGFNVSLSCQVAPEYREYERTSTVCANAFVAPIMAKYLGALRKSAVGLGAANLFIMQSSGGTLRADEAARHPIKTALSGPSGGLIAAAHTARESGFDRILTFDMGGTSTDVALIDGRPIAARFGEVAGIPLLTRMLDIHTVGAGGGSIARIDSGGGLRVGPRSAGSDPGPVAYGRGDELCVTDANVLLGRIPAAARLAGTLALDLDRVRVRFSAFAAELGTTVEKAAQGIVDVVDAQMARALRHISTERGRSAEDYTLTSFGGAGGLHACALAAQLQIPRILVPRYPGAFSALGLALANVQREYARTLVVPAEEASAHGIEHLLDLMRTDAAEEMNQSGFRRQQVLFEEFVEARYVGQSYALRIPYTSVNKVRAAFHSAHRARYGQADSTEPVEIVTVGLTATAKSPIRRIAPPNMPSERGDPIRTSSVHLDDKWVEVPMFERSSLARNQVLAGPAIILQNDATTWIDRGWTGRVDALANLILES